MARKLLETMSVARLYCPGCEPNADPLREILEVRWCVAHCPTTEGVEDEKVIVHAYLSPATEAGGAPNRAVCDFLHRKKMRRR